MNLDAPPITAEFAFSRVAEYGGTGDEKNACQSG